MQAPLSSQSKAGLAPSESDTPVTTLRQLIPELDEREVQRNSVREGVRDRGRESRPTAPEPKQQVVQERQKTRQLRSKQEDERSRTRETRPDAPVDLLPACRRTQR